MNRPACMLLIMSTVWLPCAVAAVPPSKSELLAAWESQWQRVQDMEVSFTWLNHRADPSAPGGPIPELSVTFRWDGTRWWWAGKTPDFPRTGELSYDPVTRQQRILYYLNENDRPRGEIRTTDQGYPAGLVYLGRLMRPVWTAGNNTALSELLSSSDSVVRDQTEWVDGRETAVVDLYGPKGSLVEGQVYRTVWLDIERNAVPLKVEWYGIDGRVEWTVLLRDYVQVSGVWLPMRVLTFDGGIYGPGASSELIVGRNASGEPEIAINSGLTADDCTVQYPPGTLVTNADSGEWYVATASDAPRPEVLDRIYAVGQRHRQRWSLSTALSFRWWLALAAAVASGGLFGLHSARRSTGR